MPKPGRKALPESEKKISKTFRLSPDVIRILANVGGSQAGAIEAAVRKMFGKKQGQ